MEHPACVFISYRRDDCAQEAKRLYKALARRWGPDAIYFDTESIRLGKDYKPQIARALSAVSVVVAVVGPKWAEVEDDAGERRLKAVDDWVREELFYAIRNNINLIPVFVRDAAVPNRAELPEELIDLPDLHGMTLRQGFFDVDANELARRIEGIVRDRLTTVGWRGFVLALRSWIQARLIVAIRLARSTWLQVALGLALGVSIGGIWWLIKHRS